MARNRNRRPSLSQLRKRNQDRAGMALIAACALAFAGMLWGAYSADKANGITVSQSMAAWGL